MPDARAEFEEAYRRLLPAVSTYLARRVDRADVEDLAAEVFAIAWRKRAAVTPGEELPWLYRIASFQVANHRRRLAIRRRALAFFAAPDAAPAADFAFDGDQGLVRAWRSLPGAQREVLALVVLDGLSVAEAAIALGISPNATSIRLHRSKKALAAALASADADADAGEDERSAPPAT
ncbi:MAG: RNA polymerase sigma factor [Protaetiibacter sp.]